ncbi:MAG TPA: GNAT family N-acetyltransferase [Actinomycetota bacterium]|jgi:CelD/BcsL family acetyltransferase involved in cellulose biosynthesis
MTLRLDVEELEALGEEWRELAGRTGNVFATWEWASIWWRHFGGGHRPLITSCRTTDGRLVAILPFYLWSSRPLRILRFIGHGPGDQLGPVCALQDRDEVAKATGRALARLPWSIFVGEHLPVEASWSERLGAEVIARDGNPLLRASSGGWDGFLAAQSAHFRKRLRWQERQLARHHRVAYRLVQDGEQLPAALDTLFRLHQLRWPPGSSAFQPRAAFHREFAAMALERGWLRLWILELDGQPAAALYGFRFGAVESHYQGGRDPVFDRLSLGFVLLAHAIRQALDDGVAEYRFLHGHDAYKYRFADDDPGLETITLTRGMAGRAALSAARSAYPRLKHRLGRWKWMIT